MVILQAIAAATGVLGMQTIAITTVVVGAIFGGSSVIFMARTFSRPLRDAIVYFDQIAQGNLNNDIPISNKGGAGQVLTALAATQVHLRVIIDEIMLASHEIQQHCGRL